MPEETKVPEETKAMGFTPFKMERWQSTYEHRVSFNLSESGVHPMTTAELLSFAQEPPDLGAVRLGYGQSNGSDKLRAMVASLYPGATDASVLVTIGGAEANFIAFWELAANAKSAAVFLPAYMQIPGLLENFQGEVMPVQLLEETGWRPELDQLEAALRAGAGFIVVTNPNNPTGITLSEAEMDDIVTLADRYGAWLLADEVYRGAERNDILTPTFWGRYDKVLVTNSLSKAYALPGVRLGWVVGPDDVVERLWSRNDYTTISPPSLSDELARVALAPEVRPRVLERTRRIIRSNLDVLTNWASGHDGLFTYTLPDAGAIFMTRYHADISSLALAERLRVEHSLLIVPGAHFGIESTMRIGFGLPEEELVPALERLGSAFANAGAVATS